MVCNEYSSLDSLCHDITGDAVLLSMFRAEGVTPIPCPFKSPPYTFSYNRGTGDCSMPQSRADSCTDESRLLLTYSACHDISGTESSGIYVWNKKIILSLIHMCTAVLLHMYI